MELTYKPFSDSKIVTQPLQVKLDGFAVFFVNIISISCRSNNEQIRFFFLSICCLTIGHIFHKKVFFHLLLKKLTSQSKCLQKWRFCEFFPQDMYERFSIYHFSIPQGVLFSKSIMSTTGILGWNYCHFGGGCLTLKLSKETFGAWVKLLLFF